MTRLHEKLRDKEYRDEFASAQVDTSLAFQIRAIRKQRGWSQQELGQRLGRASGQEQPSISRYETPGHSYSLTTIKKIAAAFDVALMVRFVPFSDLAGWLGGRSTRIPGLGPDSYFADGFEEDAGFDLSTDSVSNVVQFPSGNMIAAVNTAAVERVAVQVTTLAPQAPATTGQNFFVLDLAAQTSAVMSRG